MNPPLCVLSIAGSDSGGGAGIQADARTIHALGGYACTAITAVTAQNTRGVHGWQATPPRLLAAQIRAVHSDLPVAALKTGLLPGTAAIRVVARTLGEFPRVPLVVDPVIASTSGTTFLDPADVRRLRRELLPWATVVTPNWPELAALTGRSVKTFREAETAATSLAAETGAAVLAKGGHGPGRQPCRDCLVTAAGGVRWFSSSRIQTMNTHGTGCVLSAALATLLGRNVPLTRAVGTARDFLHRSLRENRHALWNGAGPAFPGSMRLRPRTRRTAPMP